MPLSRFIARRLALSVPLLLIVIFVAFILVRLGGQDPVALLAGPTATVAELETMRSELKLDQPIWVQLGTYIYRLAHLDLGFSWTSGRPVTAELLQRTPATLELLLWAIILGSAIGVPLGIRAASRPGGSVDQASRAFALLGFSIPTYWLGLVMLFIFFYLLQWAPPGMGRISLLLTPPQHITGSYFIDGLLTGNWEAARSAAAQLALPVACLAIIAAAPITRQTRAIALSVSQSEHVHYARASGLPQDHIRRMMLRSSLAPVITFIGVEIVSLIGTTALIEYVFAWGGLGYFALNAMMVGDFAVVQGYALLMALFSIVVFLVVDVLVLIIEPRASMSL